MKNLLVGKMFPATPVLNKFYNRAFYYCYEPHPESIGHVIESPHSLQTATR